MFFRPETDDVRGRQRADVVGVQVSHGEVRA